MTTATLNPADAIETLLRQAGPTAQVPTMDLASVGPEPVSKQQWLWPGRMPLGDVTVLAGAPGLGKSMLMLDIASRLSRGLEMPGGGAWSGPVDTLLISGEDSVPTLHRRLTGLGADLDRVRVVRGVHENGRSVTFDITRHFETITATLNEHKRTALLVLDPLACFTGRLDPYHPRAARTLMRWLTSLARQRRLAIVAITHLSKSQGNRGLERALGSVSVTAAARAVHFVAADPSDPQRRLLLTGKQNLGSEMPGLAYRVVRGEDGEARIEWAPDPVRMDLEDVLRPTRERATPKTDAACAFLMKSLRDGPVASTQLFEAAIKEGISVITLRRAKRALEVSSIQGGAAGHQWRLPGGTDKESGGQEKTDV